MRSPIFLDGVSFGVEKQDRRPSESGVSGLPSICSPDRVKLKPLTESLKFPIYLNRTTCHACGPSVTFKVRFVVAISCAPDCASHAESVVFFSSKFKPLTTA